MSTFEVSEGMSFQKMGAALCGMMQLCRDLSMDIDPVVDGLFFNDSC